MEKKKTQTTTEYSHFGAPLNAFLPLECVRDLAGPKSYTHTMRLLYRCSHQYPKPAPGAFSSAFASPTGEKSPTDFQGSQIELVC